MATDKDQPVDDTWMGHLHRSDRDRERRAWWEPAVLTGGAALRLRSEIEREPRPIAMTPSA